MSKELTTQTNAPAPMSPIEHILVGGDISKLSADQRLEYLKAVCESAGLNPLTRPFDYITLQGKMTLYANRGATDQLRTVRDISIEIVSRDVKGGVYIVTARAKTKDGRTDESTGAVVVEGLRGEALANAYMKAETKAKRRVTLSICGLGLLDESEVQSVLSTEKPAPKEVKSEPVKKEPKTVRAQLTDALKTAGWKKDQLEQYRLAMFPRVPADRNLSDAEMRVWLSELAASKGDFMVAKERALKINAPKAQSAKPESDPLEEALVAANEAEGPFHWEPPTDSL